MATDTDTDTTEAPAEVPTKVRVYDLIAERPRTPRELTDLIGLSRNAIQKALVALRQDRLIQRVGEGPRNAELWGTMSHEHVGNTATRAILEKIKAEGGDALPASEGVYPKMWDTLVVTAMGHDFATGHATARLQRADGVVWVVDLEMGQ